MKSRLFFWSLTAALAGFLFGFDTVVISGAEKTIQDLWGLAPTMHGLAISMALWGTVLGSLLGGWPTERFGRKKTLQWIGILYLVSAVGSAYAPDVISFMIARFIGGLGVGISTVAAPLYIAEIAPPKMRGRLVSFNQLNIVIGLSAAFFTNYLILQLGESDAAWVSTIRLAENNWRWMLSLEALPAIFYFGLLFFVPESPRWLAMKGNDEKAIEVMSRFEKGEVAREKFNQVLASIKGGDNKRKIPLRELFRPAMRLVLTIGIVIAILQQITGINAVFFYAPMIFEQTGIGTDASFANAIIIGLTNLVFTILAISFVDRLGRKPLLSFGLVGIIVFMFLLSGCFKFAEYKVDRQAIIELKAHEDFEAFREIEQLEGKVFKNDVAFKQSLSELIDPQVIKKYEGEILTSTITINAWLVLIGIIGFVASFAVSLGPVMWILFSELFPDRLRGIAISFVGVINSAVSFLVQQLFPWE